MLVGLFVDMLVFLGLFIVIIDIDIYVLCKKKYDMYAFCTLL
jgi:hypothetical protein